MREDFGYSAPKFQEHIITNGLFQMVPLLAFFGSSIDDDLLCVAAKRHHFDFVGVVIRQLRQHPVDPNGCVLIEAVSALEIGIIRILLNYGADPNAVGIRLLNVLTAQVPESLEKAKLTYEILRLLLRNGLEPNGGQPHTVVNVIKNRRLDLLQLLLQAGLNPAHRRLMVEAATMGDVPMMQLLHQHGAPFDDFFAGRTPLSASLESKNLEAIDFLLGLDVAVNAHDGLALHTVLDQPLMIEYLLKFGLDLNVDMGENVITVLKRGYNETLRIYERHGINWEIVLDRIVTRCIPDLLPRLIKDFKVQLSDQMVLRLISSCGPKMVDELMDSDVRLDIAGGEALIITQSAETRQALLRSGAFQRRQILRAYTLLKQRGEPKISLDGLKEYL